MVFITFDDVLCSNLKKYCSKTVNVNKIFCLQLILEVGEITMRKDSIINEEIYTLLAGENAYSAFKAHVQNVIAELKMIDKSEEFCFWVDFNDVRQHLNFAYFLKYFADIKNKTFVEYNFAKFSKYSEVSALEFAYKKRPLSLELEYYLEEEIYRLKSIEGASFKRAVNKNIIVVKNDYFDKYILEFITDKPQYCETIINQIFSRFGKLVVSFDQIILRMSQLEKEGIIERVATDTKYGLFFEYQFKLSDHIDMARDS